MKTVKPVSKETYELIGKAYAICSEYPDVFGDVTMRKFCGMFVDDIIDDDEDEYEARRKAYAGDMYHLLQKAFLSMADAKVDEPLRLEIDECLCHITGDPCPTDPDSNEDTRGSEHMARIRAYAPEMYALLQAAFGGAISFTEITRLGSVAQELLARIDGKEDAGDEGE